MDYKRDRPIALIKEVEPIIKSNLDLISVRADNTAFYILKDRSENSKFYFIVYRAKGQNIPQTSTIQNPIHVQFCPSSSEVLSTSELNVDRGELAGVIQSWIDVLKQYNNIQSVFDDPILSSYKDYFYEEFKVVDEDADVKPFNLQQQLLINSYLEFVISKAPNYKTADNEDNIEEIINDAKELKRSLTTLTKQKMLDGLSWMWAKMQKSGLPMLKGLLLKTQDEGVKEIVKFIVSTGKQIGKTILGIE